MNNISILEKAMLTLENTIVVLEHQQNELIDSYDGCIWEYYDEDIKPVFVIENLISNARKSIERARADLAQLEQ
tara:strand:- start:78 stop:299 length:222 start_codon:yes stop_codon:yes gene_type:complete